MDFEDTKNCQLSCRLCRWMMTLDSSREELAITCETEKYGYIGVVCAKNPLMIKLEGIQLENNNEIQLWECLRN